jgi:hypothetical protein
LPFSSVISVAHDQLVALAQDLAALAGFTRGPALEGGLRGIERGHGIVHGSAGDGGNGVFGGRIGHVETAIVGGLAPLATDPQVGRDVGEKIVVHGFTPYLVSRAQRSA